MIENSYSQDVHGPYEVHDIGNLDLEDGGTICACKLAYATFGKTPKAKTIADPIGIEVRGRRAVFALGLVWSGCMSSRNISLGRLAVSGTRDDVTI